MNVSSIRKGKNTVALPGSGAPEHLQASTEKGKHQVRASQTLYHELQIILKLYICSSSECGLYFITARHE